ncbi:MAG: ATP-binding protein [Syntrophobacteraceae bacterium]
MKHGFPGKRTGGITVELGPTAGEEILLCVRDDGVGLPHGLDIAYKSTLGLNLVSNLAGQLGGRLDMHSPDGGGSSFCVSFPIPGDTVFEDKL